MRISLLRKKGQSTLEYVIILTAIVAAVIAGAVVVKTKLQGDGGLYNKAADNITDFTGKLPGAGTDPETDPETGGGE